MSMIDCPAYYGDGVCTFGCGEEPLCITDEPVGGWLAAEARHFRDAAWEYRGVSHGLVKHFRDLTRQAEKREIREAVQAARCYGMATVVQKACRDCGCTDSRACPGGCSWVPGDVTSAGPLCTACTAAPF